MLETNVRLDESGIKHMKQLEKALGREEFDRLFPGVEIHSTEVTIRHKNEHEWRTILKQISDMPIPKRTVTNAVDDLRRSNEQLQEENHRLLQRLDKASSRTAWVAIVASTLVGILSSVVTYFATGRCP